MLSLGRDISATEPVQNLMGQQSAASQTASLLLGKYSKELKGGFLFIVAFFLVGGGDVCLVLF